jgi:hypothetical protein
MKLDFSALSGPISSDITTERWGHAEMLGTPAWMRVTVTQRIGGAAGTDGGTQEHPAVQADAQTEACALRLVPCPHLPPHCPHTNTARNANEIKASPVSPVVPANEWLDQSKEEFDNEAFEERAAIMEFDGGMTRADAEVAARKVATTATPTQRRIQPW